MGRRPAPRGRDETRHSLRHQVGSCETSFPGLTADDTSSDGSLLAYGCSDLSIGILDAKTLAVSTAQANALRLAIT